MTFGERVQAAAKKGFTERQARFLTTVVLQTGVCVPRQYARFCGIVYGAKTRKFFDRTRRAVLRGARGVLRPSIQGAVPSLETGRRAPLASAGSRAISDGSTPARGISRLSSSVTDTAISPPWLPSRERTTFEFSARGVGAGPLGAERRCIHLRLAVIWVEHDSEGRGGLHRRHPQANGRIVA